MDDDLTSQPGGERVGPREHAFFDFVRDCIRLRKVHPALHRAGFFRGRPIRGTAVRDVVWFRHDGEELSDVDWLNPDTRSLGVFFAGSGLDEVDESGDPVRDDDLILLLNASADALVFVVPRRFGAAGWTVAMDTRTGQGGTHVPGAASVLLGARSLQLLTAPWHVP